MKPESHTGQDIIGMQYATHSSYDVTANVQTVSNNDLKGTVNMQGESSNNGTASDTNEDPENVKQNSLRESIDGLILDPNEAKSPNAS